MRPGYGHGFSGLDRLQHTSCSIGFDAENTRSRAIDAAVVSNHGGRERADAHLYNNDVRVVFGSLRELGHRFLEDRGVPVDDPSRDLLVTLPRSIGYDDALVTRLFSRPSYGFVVCSIDDLHRGAFAGDRIDPRLRRSPGNKDN